MRIRRPDTELARQPPEAAVRDGGLVQHQRRAFQEGKAAAGFVAGLAHAFGEFGLFDDHGIDPGRAQQQVVGAEGPALAAGHHGLDVDRQEAVRVGFQRLHQVAHPRADHERPAFPSQDRRHAAGAAQRQADLSRHLREVVVGHVVEQAQLGKQLAIDLRHELRRRSAGGRHSDQVRHGLWRLLAGRAAHCATRRKRPGSGV
nr:hypothetical protein [Achromobacter xylosoxidans]